jgi:predicted transcriptional regulator
MARPRTGETPIRHVRVSDELWGKVGDVARRQNRTLSAAVVDALERYVDSELGAGTERDQNGTVRRGTGGNDAGPAGTKKGR